MASKENLIRSLYEHQKKGADLLAAWDGAADKKTALAFHEQEKKWIADLMELINELSPTLIVRYEILTPFEHPSPCHQVLIKWPEIEVGFRCLRERLYRLRADVIEYARTHSVYLPADNHSVLDYTQAYSDHVKATRQKLGHTPTLAEDYLWGKAHDIRREKVRELRKTSEDRTWEDSKPGPRKLGRKSKSA